MRLKQLTDSEKQKLRNSAKLELQRLENVLLDESTVQLIDEFKNRYNICETVYKILLSEYYKAKGEKPKGYLQVDMVQAPAALKFAGYTFDKESLNELFGSKSKKGKTVKKLRDATTHGIDKNAVKEILERKEELFGYMDNFISMIRSFDETA